MGYRARVAVSLALLVLAGLGIGAATGAPDPVGSVLAGQDGEPVIHITAHRYRFEPDRISLKLGEPVILELRSPEVTMSFNAPEFLVSEELPPGRLVRVRLVRVRLVPDKTGDFVFVCDIYCGSGHEKMKGVISVGSP